MEFCDVVKLVRKKLAMSQEQLARELKVSFSTVNRWENSKMMPSRMAKELFSSFCSKNNIDLQKIREYGEKNG